MDIVRTLLNILSSITPNHRKLASISIMTAVLAIISSNYLFIKIDPNDILNLPNNILNLAQDENNHEKYLVVYVILGAIFSTFIGSVIRIHYVRKNIIQAGNKIFTIFSMLWGTKLNKKNIDRKKTFPIFATTGIDKMRDGVVIGFGIVSIAFIGKIALGLEPIAFWVILSFGAIVLLDTATVAVRLSRGVYGDNALESNEVIEFIIRNKKNGGDGEGHKYTVEKLLAKEKAEQESVWAGEIIQ